MTRKTRGILFLILIILFVLITPVVILYSQGYRLDFTNKKLSQTGGFFLKAEPKQVEIYLDGKLAKKTDFLFGSVFLQNLLPKKYDIQVKKEGYYTWEKTLEVKEKEVTEARNIVLIPADPQFNLLLKNAENFWPSPDGKDIVIYESGEEGWSLGYYDLERNIESRLIREKDISSKGAELLRLEFSEDSKEIYLQIGAEEQEKSFTLELSQFPPTLSERKVAPSLPNIIVSQNYNGNTYYLDTLGNLFKSQADFSAETKINQIPFPVKNETEYKLKVFPDYIFLQEGKDLYLLNPESKSFEKFAEGIIDMKISPDKKKLVYFSDSEGWLLFIKENLEGPRKNAGEKMFLTRFSEKIGDIFWLNSNYLVFNCGNKIKISEIDDRDRINIIDLGTFENPKIFWNKTDGKLYILSGKNLFSSKKLLP